MRLRRVDRAVSAAGERMTEGRDVRTGESLTASERVQRLQRALHAKAKEAPGFRLYSLSDKVWRDDVLAVAWQAVPATAARPGWTASRSRTSSHRGCRSVAGSNWRGT